MSASTRALKKGNPGPIASLIIGIVLILIGLGIETERFRASAIVFGGILTAYGVLGTVGLFIEGDNPYQNTKRWTIISVILFFISIIVIIFSTNEIIMGIAWIVLVVSIIFGLIFYKAMKEHSKRWK